MSYIYNDEDNTAMNDDFIGYHNPTVYLSRAEMKAWDNGDIDRLIEAHEEARLIRKCQIREGFLDDLEIERGSTCRDCAWISEILSQYSADDEGNMPAFCYDLAKGICKACMANPGRKDEAIEDFWTKWEANEV